MCHECSLVQDGKGQVLNSICFFKAQRTGILKLLGPCSLCEIDARELHQLNVYFSF